MKVSIERLDHLTPWKFSMSYVIKLLLYISSEGVVNYVGKMAYEEVIDNHGNVSREELVLFSSSDFRLLFSFDFSSFQQKFQKFPFLSFSAFL